MPSWRFYGGKSVLDRHRFVSHSLVERVVDLLGSLGLLLFGFGRNPMLSRASTSTFRVVNLRILNFCFFNARYVNTSVLK